VESGARAAVAPISDFSYQWDVEIPVPGGGTKSLHTYFNLVSPGYFQTLKSPVLQGRDFADTDSEVSPRVAIVNERAARQFSPGMNPIGVAALREE